MFSMLAGDEPELSPNRLNQEHYHPHTKREERVTGKRILMSTNFIESEYKNGVRGVIWGVELKI